MFSVTFLSELKQSLPKVEKGLMLVSVAESFSDGGRSSDLVVISALQARNSDPGPSVNAVSLKSGEAWAQCQGPTEGAVESQEWTAGVQSGLGLGVGCVPGSPIPTPCLSFL